MSLSLKGPFLLSNYHNFDTWGEAALLWCPSVGREFVCKMRQNMLKHYKMIFGCLENFFQGTTFKEASTLMAKLWLSIFGAVSLLSLFVWFDSWKSIAKLVTLVTVGLFFYANSKLFNDDTFDFILNEYKELPKGSKKMYGRATVLIAIGSLSIPVIFGFIKLWIRG
jgi:hypothetical protein